MTAPRLLLIKAPFQRLYHRSWSQELFPLGLGYLAAAVRKHTHWTARIYQPNFTSLPRSVVPSLGFLAGEGFRNYLAALDSPDDPIWHEIAATVSAVQPRVVGISATSQEIRSAARVAECVRRVCPQATIVLGGPHASLVGTDVFRIPELDVAVRGEGEVTLVELLDAIDGGLPMDGVAGIVFRRGGDLIETPARPLIADLDALESPYLGVRDALIDFEKFPRGAFGRIFGVRGCPNNCTFCGSRYLWTRKVRYRSARNIVGEMALLRGMGVRRIYFVDDIFGVDPRFIRELSDAIGRECRGISWECELHVNLVRPDLVAAMRAAGCRLIQIGIESGSNEMLKKIRKNNTIEDALEAASVVVAAGIELDAFFMIGFPDETEETLRATLNAMKQIRGTINYSIYTPYPGTDEFEACRRDGLIPDDFDAAFCNHQSPQNHFCRHISRERFRILASEVERYVDGHNAGYMRRSIVQRVRRMVQQRGMLGTIKRAGRRLTGHLRPASR